MTMKAKGLTTKHTACTSCGHDCSDDPHQLVDGVCIVCEINRTHAVEVVRWMSAPADEESSRAQV